MQLYLRRKNNSRGDFISLRLLSMTMKRWKSCGQSFRNNDRISELPEALLLEILSLLPTKDVRAASVLSKRWRSLWKMVPRLEFDERMFSDNISRCLLSHQAPVLQSLHLEMNSDVFSNMVIGILVGIAFGLHVRELVLYVYGSQELFRFPFSLCNCESLETLILGQNIIIDVPSPVCLNSLRTLDLDGVGYKDDESVFNLLSGCISLENLVVHRLEQADVKTFTIAVPSLQRLTLTAENDDEDSVYVINAPSLKYLKFDGVLDDTCLIENTPELVEASLRDRGVDDDDDVSDIVFGNILGSLTSVKRLSLEISASLEIKFPTGSIFSQLVSLELHTYEPEVWNLLSLMLDSSPILQVLKLIGVSIILCVYLKKNSSSVSGFDDIIYIVFPPRWSQKKYRRKDPVACMKWNQPKDVPECLLLHLETVVWKNYQGEIEVEKEVAKYILRNTSRLKKAIFSNAYIRPEKRLERLKELDSVGMASNSCQLVFKEGDITS
ncbi:FBD domain [Arabidopsis thaliana x Arabidopsis arenosa]|uniref:FBD domain n=1 Tax=Arabidopsis thaliana x Arabidopsis arenosa TaxID=1240361 RepID=A0A8T1ZKY8_9BRAS|nr:FBD domain [Arabidopsis thaliana x Arabidopsis arenosa]